MGSTFLSPIGGSGEEILPVAEAAVFWIGVVAAVLCPVVALTVLDRAVSTGQ